MLNDLINFIYDNTISEVLKDIPEEEKKKISDSYKSYLSEMYEDVEINLDNLEQLKAMFTRLELSSWQKKNAEQKRETLYYDEYFDKLFGISGIAFEEAKIRNLTKEQVMDYLNKMKEYFDKVASYNKKVAEDYLSEASLDFMYAIGESDDKSFRISH